MRVLKRTAGLAGAGLLLMLATACGEGGASGAQTPAKGASASKAKTQAVPLRTTSQEATWTDRQETAHRLRVTPKSLVRGSVSDLDRVRLDDDLKGMTPYFLTVAFSNAGKDALGQSDLAGKLAIVGGDGVRGKGVMLVKNALATDAGLLKECRRGNAGSLAPGDTAEVCTLIMLDKGQDPLTVAYADDGGTVVWEAGDSRNATAGGTLPFKRTAETTVDDNHQHLLPIKVTPKSVRAGSLQDLRDFKLSDDDKNLVPYYVTIEYRNTGKYDLAPVMQHGGVVVSSVGGEQSRPLTLLGFGVRVEQCLDSEPHTMVKPGATVKQCSIHMLPKGDRPAVISFKGDGPDAEWTTWRATDTAGN